MPVLTVCKATIRYSNGRERMAASTVEGTGHERELRCVRRACKERAEFIGNPRWIRFEHGVGETREAAIAGLVGP
jgi:hypothetical protein